MRGARNNINTETLRFEELHNISIDKQNSSYHCGDPNLMFVHSFAEIVQKFTSFLNLVTP